MKKLHILSTTEQVAEHLRGEIEDRVWTGMMPGGSKLAKELGIGANIMEAAMKLLEKDGLLVSQGRRRGRLIDMSGAIAKKKKMRIMILLGEESDRYQPYIVELLLALQNAGYDAYLSPKTRAEIGDKVDRVAKYMENSDTDACVVGSASRELLEWFAASKFPSFAIAGRRAQVKLPSVAPDKVGTLRLAVQKLVGLGHRRIVLLCRPLRRIPEPGLCERVFLEELEKLGIKTGAYNIPHWEENADGLHKGLESLFKITPPTAVIIDEMISVLSIMQFCMVKGLQIPGDFSLVSTDSDPSFEWSKPSISHISWDGRILSERVVEWADNISQGKEDFKKGFSPAILVEGESMGPPPVEQSNHLKNYI